MERIIRMLEKEREAMSINQLAKKTGIHNVTVRKYVKIISMVRQEPMEIIKTRHSIIIRCGKHRRTPEGDEEGNEW